MTSRQSDVSQDVGTELIFENDRIRVWALVLQPGESSKFHRHENDYVFVHATPSQVKLHREGQPDEVQSYQRHFVQALTVGEGIEHQITNVGDTLHDEILLEIKGPSVSNEPLPPESNGRFG